MYFIDTIHIVDMSYTPEAKPLSAVEVIKWLPIAGKMKLRVSVWAQACSRFPTLCNKTAC